MLSLQGFTDSLSVCKNLRDNGVKSPLFLTMPETVLDKWVMSVFQIECLLHSSWVHSSGDVDEVCVRERTMHSMKNAIISNKLDEFFACSNKMSVLKDDVSLSYSSRFCDLEYTRIVEPGVLCDIMGCDQPTVVHLYLTAHWPVGDVYNHKGEFKSLLYLYKRDKLDDYFLVGKHSAYDVVAPSFLPNQDTCLYLRGGCFSQKHAQVLLEFLAALYPGYYKNFENAKCFDQNRMGDMGNTTAYLKTIGAEWVY